MRNLIVETWQEERRVGGMKATSFRSRLVDQHGIEVKGQEIFQLHSTLEATGYCVKWNFAGSPTPVQGYPLSGVVQAVGPEFITIKNLDRTGPANVVVHRNNFHTYYEVD